MPNPIGNAELLIVILRPCEAPSSTTPPPTLISTVDGNLAHAHYSSNKKLKLDCIKF